MILSKCNFSAILCLSPEIMDRADAVSLLGKICSATHMRKKKEKNCFNLDHWADFSLVRKNENVIYCFITKKCFPGLLFMLLAQVSLNFYCRK